jgi:hypothetical protein
MSTGNCFDFEASFCSLNCDDLSSTQLAIIAEDYCLKLANQLVNHHYSHDGPIRICQ